MPTLGFVAAFCAVALLAYLAKYSGRLKVSVTQIFAAPASAVYARLVDLNAYKAWSPWLALHPEAAIAITGIGSAEGDRLSWSDERIGSAIIGQHRLTPGQRVEQVLDFALPFRFKARAVWTLVERDGATKVTWSLRGRVGFAMRAFAPTVQGMLALDFRWGLDRLAAELSPGSVPGYSLKVVGRRGVPQLRCVGETWSGPIDQLPEAVPAVVEKVREGLASERVNHVSPGTEGGVAIYLKTHIKQRRSECVVGVVDPGPQSSADLVDRAIPAHTAFVVQLLGSRERLELAWYVAMQAMRMEGYKPDLRVTPFERLTSAVVTEPGDTKATETANAKATVTELHLPIQMGTT